ncbi:MAG: hypothetical protein LBV54_03435 [Puniceicoccales bacterium]|jgi:Trk-type K+ transport system membrane component|nr:hypothetical protein [Puniceicoccales bacterium]
MSHLIPEKPRGLLLFVLNSALALCGVASLGLFILLVGWPVQVEWQPVLQTATRAVLGVFVVLELFRVLLQSRPFEYLRVHKLEVFLAAVAAAEIFLGAPFYEWLDRKLKTGITASDFTLFYLAASQLTLLALLSLRTLRNNRFLAGRRLSPGLVLMFSFALAITLGTLLLMTPRATPNGIAWTDAFFTATSAVCVTGLSTLNLAQDFTRHGQCIILGLAQIGGLGVMTFTYFFAYFFAGGVSLRNRFALQDLLSENNLGQIGTVLGTIIGFTFACEAAGAAAIYSALEIKASGLLGFSGILADTTGIPADERLFFSIFHSVMAFCNAGFSTLDGNLANNTLAGHNAVLVILMLLVLAGGIGFPVVKNCWQTFGAWVLKRIGFQLVNPARLAINTKIVLITTLILCAGGTLAIYITEYLFAHTPPPETHPPLLAAAFDAVASRTAGFTLGTEKLFTPATAIILMFLMFVGGSPSSTAGGIKTTTLAVAFLSLRRILFGRKDIEAFGRRLDDSIAHRALATILLAVAFLTLVTMLLCLLHPDLPAIDLGFEAISAVCTAGMSRGITPQLGAPAKFVLVAAMFFGRVGVLTSLLAFIPRRDPPAYRLPEGNVVIN